MACWICVTNEQNWAVVRKLKVWGVPTRNIHLIRLVGVGDLLVFYVIPNRIFGISKVVSEAFTSQEEIFQHKEFGEKEIFPFRVRLQHVIVPSHPLEFKNLVPKLSFITNRQRWSGHLRKPMKLIPSDDFTLILDALRQIS